MSFYLCKRKGLSCYLYGCPSSKTEERKLGYQSSFPRFSHRNKGTSGAKGRIAKSCGLGGQGQGTLIGDKHHHSNISTMDISFLGEISRVIK